MANCRMTSLFETVYSSSVDLSIDMDGVADRCLRSFCRAAVDFPFADLVVTGTFSKALVRPNILKKKFIRFTK